MFKLRKKVAAALQKAFSYLKNAVKFGTVNESFFKPKGHLELL